MLKVEINIVNDEKLICRISSKKWKFGPPHKDEVKNLSPDDFEILAYPKNSPLEICKKV